MKPWYNYSMAIYDSVAVEYARVFDDITLRHSEWPWLCTLIGEHKPHSLLDLGCGNGYLLEALLPLVPSLYGVEPCAPMIRMAQERLGQGAALLQAGAENLPFADKFFDVIVSLLSFRYMNWDKAINEIHRVLKPEGTFILIDLFAAYFNPLNFGKYFKSALERCFQCLGNREYRRKLKNLSQNQDWQKMVQEHPRRELAEAKQAIEEKFCINREKLLSTGFRGKTVGLLCTKK